MPVVATIKNIDFINNKEDLANPCGLQLGGGGLGVHAGTEVLVDACTFQNNNQSEGGGIAATYSNLTVVDSFFIGNSAGFSGGSIWSNGRSSSFPTLLNVTDCKFRGNKDTVSPLDSTRFASSSGAPLESFRFINFPEPGVAGNIFADELSMVAIKNSTFDGNTGMPAGGALYLRENAIVKVDDSIFRNNEARGDEETESSSWLGGAVYVISRKENSHTLTNNMFVNNTAGYGGALHIITAEGARVELDGNTFKENTAWLGGGAAVLRNTKEIILVSLNASRNKAPSGGAVLMTNGVGISASKLRTRGDSTFEQNDAMDGGALFFLGAGDRMRSTLDICTRVWHLS